MINRTGKADLARETAVLLLLITGVEGAPDRSGRASIRWHPSPSSPRNRSGLARPACLAPLSGASPVRAARDPAGGLRARRGRAGGAAAGGLRRGRARRQRGDVVRALAGAATARRAGAGAQLALARREEAGREAQAEAQAAGRQARLAQPGSGPRL